ncbi:hypothetical protein HanXRQr2_Chr03g0105501 [Helianthus annuus]|uniref:Uncharacterized protein n=1 Tax=Helianthus annuus TaxID=4232 RepID=A0A9K3JE92_HELAN|nr:hypothetical protein HanXRQr2_Chr03g0105501 [Helianthus annuus]
MMMMGGGEEEETVCSDSRHGYEQGLYGRSVAGETMITLGARGDDKSLFHDSAAKLKGRKVQFDSIKLRR